MFNHPQAQRYEQKSADACMQDGFLELYEKVEKAKQQGSIWHGAGDDWFQGDEELWKSFFTHAGESNCLEIGSGPYGYLNFCHWIKHRFIIDPLADFYRAKQLELAGKTFFTPDVVTFNVGAEYRVEQIVGKIDGFVVCRNCLDHCEDPLTILYNIGQYTAPGAYLLFWTDIWHLSGTDEGHTNITKTPEMLDLIFKGLGFSILKRVRPIREAEHYLEYGIVARKQLC